MRAQARGQREMESPGPSYEPDRVGGGAVNAREGQNLQDDKPNRQPNPAQLRSIHSVVARTASNARHSVGNHEMVGWVPHPQIQLRYYRGAVLRCITP